MQCLLKLGLCKYDRLPGVSRKISDENGVHRVSHKGIQADASLRHEKGDLGKRFESKLNKPFPRKGILAGAPR